MSNRSYTAQHSNPPMTTMLLGAETEYGISANGCLPEVASLLLLHAVRRLPHLMDASAEGMFLANGSRFYIDCGHHPEIATAECDNPYQAVVCLLAGDALLRQVMVDAIPDPSLRVFKTNVCQFARATFAAHESYSHRCSPAKLPADLIPFLVSRIILTGAGGLSLHPGIKFVLSPRATFLTQDIGASSTSERGIFHTKDEPLAGHGWHRLHVLCGESLCSHRSNLLRLGTTALIVALLDSGLAPENPLTFRESGVRTMLTFNNDTRLEAKVELRNGCQLSAIEIQRAYLRFAEAHLGRLPDWAEQVCQLWRETLHLLHSDPDATATMLDWAVKQRLYLHHAQTRGYSKKEISLWNQLVEQHPVVVPGRARASVVNEVLATATSRLGLDRNRFKGFLGLRGELCELEIRFSDLGNQGLFNQLDARGLLDHRLPELAADSIQHAVHDPPPGGRAALRGRFVSKLSAEPQRYVCDWQFIIDPKEPRRLDLSDPFIAHAEWTPCERAEVFKQLRPRWDWIQLSVSTALDMVLRGQYAEAETIYRRRIDYGLEQGSGHCHLVRLYLMTDRLEDARHELERAWEVRNASPAYVVLRIHFLKVLIKILGAEEWRSCLNDVKAALALPGCHTDWTIGPMLTLLQPRILRGPEGPQVWELLSAIAAAISSASKLPELDANPLWRSIFGGEDEK